MASTCPAAPASSASIEETQKGTRASEQLLVKQQKEANVGVREDRDTVDVSKVSTPDF